MRIARYLGKLTRKMTAISDTDAVEVVPDSDRSVPARLIEINEYGCSMESREAHLCAAMISRPVRIRWKNFAEGIRGTVVRCNEKTGFAAVRFDTMSGMEYVQLLEFISERESAIPGFNEYVFKVS